MSEINVPAITIPQMHANLQTMELTDFVPTVQGSDHDRSAAFNWQDFFNSDIYKNNFAASDQWKSVSVVPIPSLVVNLGTWEKNILMNVGSPPFDTFTITTAQKNAMLVISPNWGEVANSVTLSVIILGTTYVIPNRHYAQFFFTVEGTVRSVAMIANIDAVKAYKVMICGVSFADDHYRGPQEIIVRPEETPDDGLIMTTAEILTYSENSVMRITPDWHHVVAQNSLSVTYPYSGATVTTIVPYGCSLEIAYLENSVVANIAVILSFDYKITSANLADNAVTTGKINTASVTDVKLAASSVTEGKIATGAVTETKLGTGAVTTDKLANGAATPLKVALTEGMELALGTTAFDVDTYFNPVSYHPGYILILRAGDNNQIAFSYACVNTTQTVTTYAYSAAMFVCVEQATYGRQWRPVGNYNP